MLAKVDLEIDLTFSLANLYLKEYLIKKCGHWDKE